METLQEKILKSFEEIINIEEELNSEELQSMLKKIIDMAVEEDRGENIDSDIKAATNNFIEKFTK